MSNSPADKWRWVVDCYNSIEPMPSNEKYLRFRPVLNRLAESTYAAGLYPTLSHHDLMLALNPWNPWLCAQQQPQIRVSLGLQADLNITLFVGSSGQVIESQDCEIDEAWPNLVRIIDRLHSLAEPKVAPDCGGIT
jgi:hypothetical protein